MDERGNLHLIHDVLDAQLLDRRDEKIGRVDDVVLALDAGGPPRVATIVIGGRARAHRMGTFVARIVAAIRRSHPAAESRISFDAMRKVGECVSLDVEERDIESERLERWLRDHVVCRIPGAGGERK